MTKHKDLHLSYEEIKPIETDFPEITYKSKPLTLILGTLFQKGKLIFVEKNKNYSNYHANSEEEGKRDSAITILPDNGTALLFQREYFRHLSSRCSDDVTGEISRSRIHRSGRRSSFYFYKILNDLSNERWLKQMLVPLFSKEFILPGTKVVAEYITSGKYELSNIEWNRQPITELGIASGPSAFGKYHEDGIFDLATTFNNMNEKYIEKIGLDQLLETAVLPQI